MLSFTIRVELHGAVEDDYDDLHEAMEKQSFVRCVKTTKGLRELPPGTYYGPSTSVDTALDEVREAVKTTGKRSSIFVAQTETWTSSGLGEWNE